jgi:MATE family multidrug resistance protein
MTSPTRSSSHLSPPSNPNPPPVLQHVTSEDSVVTAEIAVDEELDPESALNVSRSFTRGFRRPSVLAGSHPLHLVQGGPEDAYVEPSPEERAKLIKQEKSLLKDNNLMPSSAKSRKRSRSRDPSSGPSKFLRKVSSGRDDGDVESEAAVVPTETTGLLSASQPEYGALPVPTAEDIDRQFTTAVLAGLIKTSWRRESKVLARSSAPLILTFILQYSIHMTSVFTVGHIGTEELGAVSIGSMTASITGWSVFQGCVTALDTLCAQAYGGGNKRLVGLHLQRMVWFLMCVLIPIGIFWLNAGALLKLIVPEKRTAELAGLYLKVIILAAPGNILYECGKRYLMCQGIFDPILYILLVCAPLNVFLNYLFVWVSRFVQKIMGKVN